jgi:ADP-ribose pyrophosphatase YjhB (NUDIX family)
MLDYIRTLRSKIGTMKILVPGVRTLIFDDAGRVLLGRQRLFGSWSLPHGCVDVGESALDAAIRETEEEVGVRIEQGRLFGVYTDPKYSVEYPNRVLPPRRAARAALRNPPRDDRRLAPSTRNGRRRGGAEMKLERRT